MRDLYTKVSRPGMQHFREMLDKNLILNCPFTSTDDVIANDIFGQDLAMVRGRKLRKLP